MMNPNPRLVLAQQDPITLTIQGEGPFVGTPAVFVRLFGCTTMCPWCDTKYAWQHGYGVVEMLPQDLAAHLNQHYPTIRDIVFTGGNPMLQGELLLAAVKLLSNRRVLHIETEGSAYYDKLLNAIDNVVLSPKLWNWPKKVLPLFYGYHQNKIITKIVVATPEEVDEALERFKDIHAEYPGNRGFVLQPRDDVDPAVIIEAALANASFENYIPNYSIRIIPQVHKMVGMP